jgi:predicted nucleic acid-binding Zn ribbon protein
MADTSLPEKTERAAVSAPVVAFQEALRPCPVCGAPMTGRQTSACSDRCRATKSRQRRIPLPVAEAKMIRASLTTALEAVWEAKATLERYGE